MLNSIGIDIPATLPGISGRPLYQSEFANKPAGKLFAKAIRMNRPGHSKLLGSIEQALDKTGLKNGMTISFHHHLRNGDYTLKLVMAAIAAKGFKDITIAASSLSSCHDFLTEYIEAGVVTALETSGVRGALGKYLTENPGKLKKPVVVRSHGGRARAIEAGELKIDVAFMAASACDRFGNCTGSFGKSAFGSMGYAITDSRYAEQTVIITDNLLDGFVYPYSIPQNDVDFIVPVTAIGNPEKIASGAIRISTDPVQLLLAEYSALLMQETGYIRQGLSLQMGSGGASLTAAKFIREIMEKKEVKGSFAIGGATGVVAKMLEDGLFEVLYDAQSFDTAAVQSLHENPRHLAVSVSHYANPWNAGPLVNDLDVAILSATEVDTNFNVNVITDSNGVLMGASGGHCDAAAGAKLAIIVVPLIRGRLPMIRDRVHNVITPGSSIDAIVTERGIAINPKRTDLLEKLQGSQLPVMSISDLQKKAHSLVGRPEPIKCVPGAAGVVAVVEYRDGSILDIIRKPQY